MQLEDIGRVNTLVIEAIKRLIKDNDLFMSCIMIFSDGLLYGHCLGVAQYSVQIAISYGYNDEELITIAEAGILHDVGKLYIDRKILYKPGRLTDDEFKLVKKHPVYGYNDIKEYTDNQIILNVIRHHHEKLTGKGYPDEIEDISFIVQMITVADIFSALTEARVYKKAMPAEKAFEIMEDDDGINQEIVSVLKSKVFDEYAALLRARKLARYYRKKFQTV